MALLVNSPFIHGQNATKSPSVEWRNLHPESSPQYLRDYAEYIDSCYEWESPEQEAYLQKGLDAAQKLNYDTLIFDFGYQLGNFYLAEDSLFDALSHLTIASGACYDDYTTSTIYNMLGYTYTVLEDYQTGIDFYFKSVDIKNENEPTDAAYSFVNISSTYNDLKDYDNAIKYTWYSNKLAQQMEYPEKEYISLFNYDMLANSYKGLNQKDSARFYIERGLDILPRIDTIKHFKFYEATKMIYVDAADIYLTLGMSEIAAKYLQKLKAYKLTYHKVSAVRLEATYELQKNNPRKALEILNKLVLSGLHFTETEPILQLKIDAYQQLNQPQKAIEIYQALVDAQNAEVKSDRARISRLADIKFESLKKDEEIKSLRLDQEVKSLALQNQRYILLSSILAAVILLVLALYMRSRAQARKKLSEYLQKEVAAKTQDLQKANEELRVLNYIASHDIKEPIRNIGSYIGLIGRKIPTEIKPRLNEYFVIIQKSIQQLYTLVEDVATYINMSKDETIELEYTDMNQLIASIFFSMDTYREERGGKLQNDGVENIKTSRTMIYIILKNLIENGLQYNNSSEPRVIISYQSTADFHQILVSDNGIGIEKQYQDKIFESFKRLHNRGAYEGSGIGLSIVKLLTEKLNGHIQVESTLGVGSTFIINLPKTEEA